MKTLALNLYLVGARFLETETSYRIQTQSGKSWGKVNIMQKMWSDLSENIWIRSVIIIVIILTYFLFIHLRFRWSTLGEFGEFFP